MRRGLRMIHQLVNHWLNLVTGVTLGLIDQPCPRWLVRNERDQSHPGKWANPASRTNPR